MAKIILSNNKIVTKNNKILIVGESPTPTFTGLCFTANTSGSTIGLRNTGSTSIPWTGEYSFDGNYWATYDLDTTGNIILSNIGDKVYFKGDISGHFASASSLQFYMSGSIAASGNCNSLYSANDFETLSGLSYNYCYNGLFSYCASLTSSPTLPSLSLSYGCYSEMFRGCTSLVTPPALPAIYLTSYCYSSMFRGCTSLTSVPELPATDVVSSKCYNYMFNGCTALYVSDTSTSASSVAWRIPSSGTFTNTASRTQTYMFTNCRGTRSSNNFNAVTGSYKIYYTQNTPI